MKEFMEAIAAHPWVSLFVAIFVLSVIEEIGSVFKRNGK